ncbi:MAG: glycosyltransferase family 39 protein [Patescibacteria group bacterium]
MNNKKAYFFLFVIIIIAGFFRLNQLKTAPPGLYPDEAMNGNNALESLGTGHFKVFYPENNGREGLFINIQALFLKAFGMNEPWVLRLPSAIFGILTVLGLFFLTRELFGGNPKPQAPTRGDKIALLASFLLATSFWHINFSRIGFRAIMAPFFIVWASYFFFYSIRKNADAKKWLPLAAISGVFLGLGLYSYIAYRIMPLLFLVSAVLLIRKENVWKIFIVVAAFAVITFLPLGVYFIQNPADFLGRTSQVSIFASLSPVKDLLLNTVKTLGMFNFVGDYNWRHNLSGKPELFWPVGILFIVGIIYAAGKIFAKTGEGREDLGRPSYLFLFSWSILGLLPVVISNEGIPHALRSILLIPPAIIFSALGGAVVYGIIKKHIGPALLKTIIIAFLFVVAAHTYYSYFVVWAKNSETYDAFSSDYAEIGRKINELPREVPKYVVVEGNGVDARGIPMSAQTVMFMTNTFLREDRLTKNVHYILPKDKNNAPENAIKFYLR